MLALATFLLGLANKASLAVLSQILSLLLAPILFRLEHSSANKVSSAAVATKAT